MGVAEMEQVAAWIDEVISDIGNERVQQRVAAEVQQMCEHFPVPGTEGYEEPAAVAGLNRYACIADDDQ
jgi:hypothetical protein